MSETKAIAELRALLGRATNYANGMSVEDPKALVKELAAPVRAILMRMEMVEAEEEKFPRRECCFCDTVFDRNDREECPECGTSSGEHRKLGSLILQ